MSFTRVIRSNKLLLSTIATTTIGCGMYMNNNNNSSSRIQLESKPTLSLNKISDKFNKTDYQKIYNQIATKLRDEDEYDNYIGYGPVLLRLSWHSSGTYSQKQQVHGGSYGGTMRFEKEFKDPSNAGLENALDFLKPIYEENKHLISHGDLFTLGGVVAVQELQGPKIPWRSGRKDMPLETTPENGRLPDANGDSKYVRNYFNALNFLKDEEIVALLGAHCLGKTHLKNSGFEGPWGAATNVFTNEYFKNLLDEKWELQTNEAGNKQWNSPKKYMMLPADMALVQDDKFKGIVESFAKDQSYFFDVYAKSFSQLLENGIEFPSSQKTWLFKTLDEQDS